MPLLNGIYWGCRRQERKKLASGYWMENLGGCTNDFAPCCDNFRRLFVEDLENLDERV